MSSSILKSNQADTLVGSLMNVMSNTTTTTNNNNNKIHQLNSAATLLVSTDLQFDEQLNNHQHYKHQSNTNHKSLTSKVVHQESQCRGQFEEVSLKILKNNQISTTEPSSVKATSYTTTKITTTTNTSFGSTKSLSSKLKGKLRNVQPQLNLPTNNNNNNNNTNHNHNQTHQATSAISSNDDRRISIDRHHQEQQQQQHIADFQFQYNNMKEELFKIIHHVPMDLWPQPRLLSANEPTCSPTTSSGFVQTNNSEKMFSLDLSEPVVVKYYFNHEEDKIVDYHFRCSLMKYNFESGLQKEQQQQQKQSQYHEPYKSVLTDQSSLLASSSSSSLASSSSCSFSSCSPSAVKNQSRITSGGGMSMDGHHPLSYSQLKSHYIQRRQQHAQECSNHHNNPQAYIATSELNQYSKNNDISSQSYEHYYPSSTQSSGTWEEQQHLGSTLQNTQVLAPEANWRNCSTTTTTTTTTPLAVSANLKHSFESISAPSASSYSTLIQSNKTAREEGAQVVNTAPAAITTTATNKNTSLDKRHRLQARQSETKDTTTNKLVNSTRGGSDITVIRSNSFIKQQQKQHIPTKRQKTALENNTTAHGHMTTSRATHIANASQEQQQQQEKELIQGSNSSSPSTSASAKEAKVFSQSSLDEISNSYLNVDKSSPADKSKTYPTKLYSEQQQEQNQLQQFHQQQTNTTSGDVTQQKYFCNITSSMGTHSEFTNFQPQNFVDFPLSHPHPPPPTRHHERHHGNHSPQHRSYQRIDHNQNQDQNLQMYSSNHQYQNQDNSIQKDVDVMCTSVMECPGQVPLSNDFLAQYHTNQHPINDYHHQPTQVSPYLVSQAANWQPAQLELVSVNTSSGQQDQANNNLVQQPNQLLPTNYNFLSYHQHQENLEMIEQTYNRTFTSETSSNEQHYDRLNHAFYTNPTQNQHMGDMNNYQNYLNHHQTTSMEPQHQINNTNVSFNLQTGQEQVDQQAQHNHILLHPPLVTAHTHTIG